MIKLLVQSDDYGITRGVSAGIIEGIKKGIIRNTGLFVNMPCSYQAAKDIKDLDVCLGIDINYVCGTPVSDINLIPHLVDENGRFYKSGSILERYQIISKDKFGLITTFDKDPYPYEEIYLETENQVKKFIELIGRLPDYIHAHSLCTPNTHKAASEIAKKYGIKHSFEMMYNRPYLSHTFSGIKENSIQEQLESHVVERVLNDLQELEDNQTYYYISHCGYVDYELFRESSLTLRRIKDLDAMLDKEIINYIQKLNIQLITYKDLT